jgi:hypothetical protein
MITRTYPSECSLYNCDDMVISEIRGLLGDPVVLKRFYVSAGGDFSEYVPNDPYTFTSTEDKFWPYSLKVGNTTCSGVDCAQLINYHYLSFDESYNLVTSGIDFWLETFKFSDYDIWTAYLSVDLSPLVLYPECITPYMEMLKVAIDMSRILRGTYMDDMYVSREVTDKNTSYKRVPSSADPWKDLMNKLQAELDDLIERNCRKRIYRGGIRQE